jgi:hypothetical protein
LGVDVASPMTAPRVGGGVTRDSTSQTSGVTEGGDTDDRRWRHQRQKVATWVTLRWRHGCHTKLAQKACLEASYEAHAFAMSRPRSRKFEQTRISSTVWATSSPGYGPAGAFR